MTGVDSELESIINGCLNNNRLSQRQLYDKYASKMFAVCRRYANTEAEAEDMLMEGFMKVFKSLSSFEGKSAFDTWLHSVMVNTAISHYRSVRRFCNELSISEMNDVNEAQFASEEETITTSLDAGIVMEALRKMPEPFRTVFNLRAVEAFSFAEIGKLLGKREKSLRVTYLRARKWLLEELKE